MPNWCSTDYTIINNDGSNTNPIADVLKRLNENKTKGSFVNIWLVDILKELGVSEEELTNTMYVRGYINDYSADGNELKLYCETAWSETPDFRHRLEEMFPDLDITYTAIEPGCCVYLTNDPEYEGGFVVDCYNDTDYSGDIYTKQSKQQMFKDICNAAGAKYDDCMYLEEIEDIVAEFNKKNEDKDYYISIHYFDWED